jgi:hypothetical protein
MKREGAGEARCPIYIAQGKVVRADQRMRQLASLQRIPEEAATNTGSARGRLMS